MKQKQKTGRYKIKLMLLFCSCFFFTHFANAQNFTIFSDKSIGGDLDERNGKILFDNVNGLIVHGESWTNISGDKLDPNCDPSSGQKDLWFLKLDTALNVVWQNDIGGSFTEQFSNANFSNQTGQLLFSCESHSDSSCDKSSNHWSNGLSFWDYWIGQLDSSGAVIWEKTLGSTGLENKPELIQFANGNCLVCGISGLGGISGDKSVNDIGFNDVWCVMLDSLHTKIWDKVYGGTGSESNSNFDLLKDTNGSFICTVGTPSPTSGSITDSSRGGADIWVIKIDSAGNKMWDKRFGGNSQDFSNMIIATNDNGYLIGGNTTSQMGFEVSEPPLGSTFSDIWIVKTDSIGNKQWDKRFGGAAQEYNVWVEQDFDGGYLVGCTTLSDSGYSISEHAYGSSDYWILKIDSLGNKIWDKRFGGSGNNVFTSFTVLPDSSIVLMGHADSGLSAVKTDPGHGGFDFWLIRFKYENNSSGFNEFNSSTNLVSVYPNPTSGEITISPMGTFRPDEFYLYDATGRIIYFDELNDNTIDISKYPPALYFYEIKSRDGIKAYGKLLKQ